MPGTISPVLYNSGNITAVVIDFVADASAATYPNDVVIKGLEGHITNAYFVPGTTPPTNLFDVTVEWNGVDLLGGAGADIAVAANALITPKNTVGDPQYSGFAGPITPKAINNAVNSAAFKLILIIAR